MLQLLKRLLAHWLTWYTRTLCEFHLTVSRSLEEMFYAVENLSTNLVALDGRLAQTEKKRAVLTQSTQEQFEFLHEQAKALAVLQKAARLGAKNNRPIWSNGGMSPNQPADRPWVAPGFLFDDIDEVQRTEVTVGKLRNGVGIVDRQPQGVLVRLLSWYTRPLREFNAVVSRSLEEILWAVENLAMKMHGFERRLAQAENSLATLTASMRDQLELLHEQLMALVSVQKTASLEERQTLSAGWNGEMNIGSQLDRKCTDPHLWLHNIDVLRCEVASIEEHRSKIAVIIPRASRSDNKLVQPVRKLLAHLLIWYTQPLSDFNSSVSRSLEEIFCAIEEFSTNIVAMGGRLAEAENGSAILMESVREQLDFLHERVNVLLSLPITANLKIPAGMMENDSGKQGRENPWCYMDAEMEGNRTAYIIGLFGTGRLYINALIRQNIGERAIYFRDQIRLHPGPTSMIYSGHATMRNISRAQAPPAVMSSILEAVRSRFADLIFIYRHPLDSLLTNWIWWRTYIREHREISGISQVYKNTDDLCAELEKNFLEFKGFAEDSRDFFAAVGGPRFLSFPEFVEETELHLQSAPHALRLEDFMIDPFKEFSKIVEVMSVDLDLSLLRVVRPRTKPYGYLAVQEKVSRFRDFINGLDVKTKKRIEKIGYSAIA